MISKGLYLDFKAASSFNLSSFYDQQKLKDFANIIRNCTWTIWNL